MNVLSVLQLIFSIISSIFGLMMIHFIFFAIVGVFKRKKFPHTEEKLKYGIIIPARNEEDVVGGLIESVQKNKYPQEKLHIFVIAHNCTDRTAEIARGMGATVYEYNNPAENTMGYAFRYLFDRIKEDYGTENYDGFFLFNADNILDENYFDKMNDAFVACDRKSVITSFRNSKNFGSNVMSAMYGLYFCFGCRYESRGRTVLGCSTRVQGTGYVINSEIVKDGWQYVTLAEDWEFTADQVLRGRPIVYCDEAVFYDEQPTSWRVMWKQRLRWSRGHLLVFYTRFRHMIKSLFTRRSETNQRKGSKYDIMINILPVCLISTVLGLTQVILTFLTPIVDGGAFWQTLKNWAFGFFAAGDIKAGTGVLASVVGSLVVVAFAALLIYILEHRRIPKVKWYIKLASVLLFPIFLFISVPNEIVAFFMRRVDWVAIPHTDTTNFDALNGREGTADEDALPEETPVE